MPLRKHHEALERVYARYHSRRYVSPDPLQFLYDYEDPRDWEVVALVASSLAYGRVAQILRSVGRVLEVMGPHPRRFVLDTPADAFAGRFAGFRHRFCDAGHLAALLGACRDVLQRHGSLEACFAAGLDDADDTTHPALGRFVAELAAAAGGRCGHLLADPRKGSACKRLHLMLRWLVRRDDVDPGGWSGVSPAMLVVPLDTHMHRLGVALGATKRRRGDGRAAREITAAFARVCPDDPSRYDFALTRLGIRSDGDLAAFLRQCRAEAIAND